ncbi:MAG: hypothetical protein IKS47_00030 [Bacteroidales bacterium]|jgi:hypothetical protein|nr:hypothetical protein [Bacteroidales bacterium]
MSKGLNGISPIVAILLTVLVAVLCVVFFVTHHVFWGVVFALITLDFFADVVLAFKKA